MIENVVLKGGGAAAVLIKDLKNKPTNCEGANISIGTISTVSIAGINISITNEKAFVNKTANAFLKVYIFLRK